MIRHIDIENGDSGKRKLHRLIREGKILFAGNAALKIFGKLSCRSGKRMRKSNRVFFQSEEEAISLGYRPCGHCLRKKYRSWKSISPTSPVEGPGRP